MKFSCCVSCLIIVNVMNYGLTEESTLKRVKHLRRDNLPQGTRKAGLISNISLRRTPFDKCHKHKLTIFDKCHKHKTDDLY